MPGRPELAPMPSSPQRVEFEYCSMLTNCIQVHWSRNVEGSGQNLVFLQEVLGDMAAQPIYGFIT